MIILQKYKFLLLTELMLAIPTAFSAQKHTSLVELEYCAIGPRSRQWKINDDGSLTDQNRDMSVATYYAAKLITNSDNKTVLSFDASLNNEKAEKRTINIVTPSNDLRYTLNFNTSNACHVPITCIHRSVEPTILNDLVDLDGNIYFKITMVENFYSEKKPPVPWFNNINTTLTPLLCAGLFIILGILYQMRK